ncbi:MAG: helix-turn-helix domain-containing protein [Pseudonocardia sp.]
MRRALADYDFATVLRSVRRTTDYSQERLGELVGLSQSRISLIERRTHRLRDIAIVSRIASHLGIPPDLLGFTIGTSTVETTGHSDDQEVDWVFRRDFVTVVSGTTLGLGTAPLDLDRLAALLPHTGVEPPGRIGAADVAAIEQVTAALRSCDFSRGGGLFRDAAVAQLRSVLTLRNQECASPVRARLLVAAADLGLLGGWMNYDSELHADARRLWVLALELARQAEHPAAVDLTVDLLLRMTHQALHLHRVEEAERLVQLGHAAVVSGTHPVSTYTANSLATNQAWCHAARGDAAACDRALDRSVELLDTPETTATAPWSAHVGSAELAARQGHAYFTLAMASGNLQHAARAVPLLQEAVRDYGPNYARARAIQLPGLAGAHALIGDLNAAAHVGGQAVTEITALSSRRALGRLRTLDTVVGEHGTEAPAAELREQIRSALTPTRP